MGFSRLNDDEHVRFRSDPASSRVVKVKQLNNQKKQQG